MQTADNSSYFDFYVELLMKVSLGESDIAVGGLPLYSRLIVFEEPTIQYFETPISWRYVTRISPAVVTFCGLSQRGSLYQKCLKHLDSVFI